MAYTEFYVTKGALAANTCGGGPNLGADDGPIYALVGGTGAGATAVDNGANSNIEDLSNGGWSGVAVDDWLCFDTAGAKQFARVIARDVGGVDFITVSPQVTAAADKTCKVGGAWATVDFAASTVTTAFVNAAGEPPRVNIGLGTYAETVVMDNSFAYNLPGAFEGYQATAGDGCPAGTRPIIDGTGIAAAVIAATNMDYLRFRHLSLVTNLDQYCLMLNSANDAAVENVTAANSFAGAATKACFYFSERVKAINCAVTDSPGDGFRTISYDCVLVGCRASGCARYGFYFNQSSSTAIGCIASGNGDDGFYLDQYGGILMNSVSYDNAGSGIRLDDAATPTKPLPIINCIFAENAVAGIECDVNTYGPYADYNAFYRNGPDPFTTHRLNIGAGAHDVTLTADPFVNAAGGNFALNSAAGGGALLKAAGFPGTLIDAVNIGYTDIGALQVQAAGGGGMLFAPDMSGGL